MLEFLRDEEVKGFAVLGGDVVLVENGKLSYTYDNWYTDSEVGEAYEHYCARSRAYTLEYVLRYPSEKSVIFAPVMISSYPDWMPGKRSKPCSEGNR